MKKYMKITLIMCILGMMFLMAGCGKGGVPKEKDIIRDLQEANLDRVTRGERYIDLNIDSLKIDRQRVDDKEMVAYCIIDMHNNDVKATMYYELFYIYYDKGGWILEDCVEWEKAEYTPLSGVNVQEAVDELLADNYYRYSEVEFVAEETNLEACEAKLTFDTIMFWDNCTVTGQITAEYKFERGLWKLCDIVSGAESVDFSPLVGKTYKSEMEEVNFIAMDEENKTITLEYLDLYHEDATWQQKTVRYVVVDNIMYIERVYYSYADFFGRLHYVGVELWVNETGTGRIQDHSYLSYSDDSDKGISGQMIEQYY